MVSDLFVGDNSLLPIYINNFISSLEFLYMAVVCLNVFDGKNTTYELIVVDEKSNENKVENGEKNEDVKSPRSEEKVELIV